MFASHDVIAMQGFTLRVRPSIYDIVCDRVELHGERGELFSESISIVVSFGEKKSYGLLKRTDMQCEIYDLSEDGCKCEAPTLQNDVDKLWGIYNQVIGVGLEEIFVRMAGI